MIENPDQLVVLTADAAARVRELLAREPEASGRALRLSVDEDCCSGYRYGFDFDHARDDDDTGTSEGVTIVVDPQNAPYLLGSLIDFVLDLQHSGFKVDNPNAASTCRCGQSFETEPPGRNADMTCQSRRRNRLVRFATVP
jgi:iron-sulfur cluster assembly accessory protein